MKELGAEVGGGLIIHHGLIIRTLRYCLMEGQKDETNSRVFCALVGEDGCMS